MQSPVKESQQALTPQRLGSLDWAPYPPMKLSVKQRSYLKGLAHPLKPVVRIGQEGITGSVIGEIRHQLLCHELIKVKWASLSKQEGKKKVQAEELAERVGAHYIHLIGQTVLLYREPEPQYLTPPKIKQIKLPA